MLAPSNKASIRLASEPALNTETTTIEIDDRSVISSLTPFVNAKKKAIKQARCLRMYDDAPNVADNWKDDLIAQFAPKDEQKRLRVPF